MNDAFDGNKDKKEAAAATGKDKTAKDKKQPLAITDGSGAAGLGK